MALTHFSGGLRIASGLNITGAAHFGGALTLDTQLGGAQLASAGITGRAFATGSNGLLQQITFPHKTAALAAASGTLVTGWACALGHAAVIRGFGLSLAGAIRGGSFGIKIFTLVPGAGITYTAKSAVGTGVGTVGIRAVARMGFAITVPARASIAVSINKVGSTTAGTGGQLSLFYTYN